MLTILPKRQVAARLEDHYGLPQRPFGLTLDQRFLYPSASYVAALTEVRRALQRREGLVVVTGAPGTGKTLLCRALLAPRRGGTGEAPQPFDPPTAASIVLDPCVTSDDLLRHVLTDFGVSGAANLPTRHHLMRALQQFLSSLIPIGGYAVLVIDEAQDLQPSVMEQLRLLLNLETDEAKLLQIVLIGQPELNDILARPGMRQLEQRVARRCELEPLAFHEVGRYIEHRLSTARRLMPFADGELLWCEDMAGELPSSNLSFTPAATRAVATASHGIPRMVNLVCDRALDIGYERQRHTIDTRIVRAATARLPIRASVLNYQFPTSQLPTLGSWRLGSWALSACFVLALGIGTWTWAGDAPSPALPAAPAAFDTVESWAESLPASAVKTLAVVDPSDVTTTTGSPADRAQLIRPSLVRAGDRISFALQMTAEPRKAALRMLSARALALDVGPVAGPLRAEELAPGADMAFLRQVSLRPTSASNGQVFVRARLTFEVPTRGNVRVAGRTVFVDLEPMTPSAGPKGPALRAEHSLPPAAHHVGRVLPDPPSRYRENLRPLLARLHEIKPFLLSAATAPTDSVLNAVGRTVTAVEAPLRVMDVPLDARTSHNVLASAVAMASRAIARDFTGDRVAEAQRAFALIEGVTPAARDGRE